MRNAPDLLAFRTGRSTILVGPLAAFGRAGSELLLDGQAAIAQALDLLFGSRGETHLIRQFCIRWGLDAHNVFGLDDRALRGWLANGARQGRLGVASLPHIVCVAALLKRKAAELISDVGADAGDLVLSRDQIQAMDLEARFVEVLRRVLTGPHLPAPERQQLRDRLTAATLERTIAVLVSWGRAHGIGFSYLVEIALSTPGAAPTSPSFIEDLKQVAEFLDTVRQVSNAGDLDRAARFLALALRGLGVEAFMRLIINGAPGPTGMSAAKSAGLETKNRGTSGRAPIERLQLRPPPQEQQKPPAAPTSLGQSMPIGGAAREVIKIGSAGSTVVAGSPDAGVDIQRRQALGLAASQWVDSRTGNLDTDFGTAQPPGGSRGIKPFEQAPDDPKRAIRNPTLQKPTLDSPPKLDPAKAKDPGYIWAIDKDGQLLIGEEVPTGKVEPSGYVQKLGHPTLTEGGTARVAGEIKYIEGKGWMINNSSGRYSSYPDRGPLQLENAAGVFKDLGVDVVPNFAPLRRP